MKVVLLNKNCPVVLDEKMLKWLTLAVQRKNSHEQYRKQNQPAMSGHWTPNTIEDVTINYIMIS